MEPYLQAEIDLHSGVLAAHEGDFELAFSYFYEAFDTFNINTVNKKEKALRCLKLMILAKIMDGKLNDIHNIVAGKAGLSFMGKDVEAFISLEKAVRNKSIVELKSVVKQYEEQLVGDNVITNHLESLQNNIVEKNLIQIIEPYSMLEIDFIVEKVGLPKMAIQAKLSQMILDKLINGILDQGRGCLIIYEEAHSNEYLDKSLQCLKNIDLVVESLTKKIRASAI